MSIFATWEEQSNKLLIWFPYCKSIFAQILLLIKFVTDCLRKYVGLFQVHRKLNFQGLEEPDSKQPTNLFCVLLCLGPKLFNILIFIREEMQKKTTIMTPCLCLWNNWNIDNSHMMYFVHHNDEELFLSKAKQDMKNISFYLKSSDKEFKCF